MFARCEMLAGKVLNGHMLAELCLLAADVVEGSVSGVSCFMAADVGCELPSYRPQNMKRALAKNPQARVFFSGILRPELLSARREALSLTQHADHCRSVEFFCCEIRRDCRGRLRHSALVDKPLPWLQHPPSS